MPASFPYSLLAATALVSAPALAQPEEIQLDLVQPIIVFLPPPPPPFIVIDPPAALPPNVRLMIETAIAGGDEATARHVIAVARKVAPRGDKDIDAIENAWKNRLAARAAEQEEKRLASLRNAGPFDAWKGSVEVGGFRSTGTSSSLGAFAAINLERATIDWSHRLVANADIQETNGDTSAERLLASWQPNYRFSKQAYGFGIAQYERDPFAGYEGRATLGVGIGYRPLNTPALKLELEGGPAIRHTVPIDGFDRTHLVGRGSLNLQWQVLPTVKLTQRTAVFLENDASNVVATTALDTKLIGTLKSRISYNVQYEGDTPVGTNPLSTQSRVTFLYGF
jgi:putative salt-induced outer membrane protein